MSASDLLLRSPDDRLNLPSHLTGDLLRAALEAVVDHMSFHAMTWPAKDARGLLVRPPDEHLLHELAHEYELADEEDLWAHPKLCTVAFLSELPECVLCGDPARYDSKLTDGGRIANAHLCRGDYAERGSGTLGASGDTYLMLVSEIPEEVRAICNERRADQGKQPIF